MCGVTSDTSYIQNIKRSRLDLVHVHLDFLWMFLWNQLSGQKSLVRRNGHVAVLGPNQNVLVKATPVFLLDLPALVGAVESVVCTLKVSCQRWAEELEKGLKGKHTSPLIFCKNQQRKWKRWGARAEKMA